MPEIWAGSVGTRPKSETADGGGGGGGYSTCSPPPETELFGKYSIGKLLGRGAFAKVYHARTVDTGESVAIKAVSKQKVAKSGCAAHVKREIAIMRRLRHPHVVKLKEVLATKTKVYFVMEFAKGGELFAKVAKGRFSEDLSRRYFHQLISAVRYCHSRGVYHRDLKPENLLLDENWDLKVSDFGLSAISDPTRPENSLLHTLCGTPAYVAPEILAKKGYDGAKVDVWTCGVVLFVLTAGYLPFNDQNLIAMYRKIYKGEFRFPRWASPELRRIISRLLDVNPETRITIDQILRDPWFNKGFRERELKLSPMEEQEPEPLHLHKKSLNAFDIISFSSGFNLSGLFGESDISASEERFLSAEPPERVVERVGQVAMGEGLTATWKAEGWWARVEEGEGQNGDFAAAVEVHRLTAELVVVEVRLSESGGANIWKDKLWPKLEGLVFRPCSPVSGDGIEI